MTPADQIQQHLYLSSKTILEAYSQVEQIKTAAKLLSNRWCIYLCGNGGSAADCAHLAAELIAGGVSAVALTTDTSVLTSISNDYGYEQVFSKQLESHLDGQSDSCSALVCISTSGQSGNVLQAARTARKMNMPVVALTGKGVLKDLANVAIVVQGTVEHAQEAFLAIEHILAILIVQGRSVP